MLLISFLSDPILPNSFPIPAFPIHLFPIQPLQPHLFPVFSNSFLSDPILLKLLSFRSNPSQTLFFPIQSFSNSSLANPILFNSSQLIQSFSMFLNSSNPSQSFSILLNPSLLIQSFSILLNSSNPVPLFLNVRNAEVSPPKLPLIIYGIVFH